MATDKDNTLIKKSIDDELWREYEWDEVRLNAVGVLERTGERVVYRILEPRLLVIRPGGTTHRVVDNSGVVHCVTAGGIMGCVLRWKTRDGQEPVGF
jgi:hypothetical protein